MSGDELVLATKEKIMVEEHGPGKVPGIDPPDRVWVAGEAWFYEGKEVTDPATIARFEKQAAEEQQRGN